MSAPRGRLRLRERERLRRRRLERLTGLSLRLLHETSPLEMRS